MRLVYSLPSYLVILVSFIGLSCTVKPPTPPVHTMHQSHEVRMCDAAYDVCVEADKRRGEKGIQFVDSCNTDLKKCYANIKK